MIKINSQSIRKMIKEDSSTYNENSIVNFESILNKIDYSTMSLNLSVHGDFLVFDEESELFKAYNRMQYSFISETSFNEYMERVWNSYGVKFEMEEISMFDDKYDILTTELHMILK